MCKKIYGNGRSEEIFELYQGSWFEEEELFYSKCCEKEFNSEDSCNEEMLCEICLKQDSLVKMKDKFWVCFKCASEIDSNTCGETFND